MPYVHGIYKWFFQIGAFSSYSAWQTAFEGNFLKKDCYLGWVLDIERKRNNRFPWATEWAQVAAI